eukprot:TRINITY_DN2229_c0_g3_i1.p1 TRINITY_DN2229_c0_g3~~TRINITY_DN2229_c0_g3_i1.p1  ORF type:complete len:1784 (+),score=657.52 TRINITY_DN2229_c0_g3_i1:122-5353(+)
MPREYEEEAAIDLQPLPSITYVDSNYYDNELTRASPPPPSRGVPPPAARVPPARFMHSPTPPVQPPGVYASHSGRASPPPPLRPGGGASSTADLAIKVEELETEVRSLQAPSVGASSLMGRASPLSVQRHTQRVQNQRYGQPAAPRPFTPPQGALAVKPQFVAGDAERCATPDREATLRAQLRDLEDELRRREAQEAKVGGVLEVCEGALRASKEKHEALSTEHRRVLDSLSENQDALAGAEQRLADATADRRAAETARDRNASALRDSTEVVHKLTRDLRQAEARLADAGDDALALRQQLTSLELERAQLEQGPERLRMRHDRLRRAAAAALGANRGRAALAARFGTWRQWVAQKDRAVGAGLSAELAASRARAEQLAQECRSQDAALVDLQREMEEHRRGAARAEAEAGAARGQHQAALAAADAEREALREAVRRLEDQLQAAASVASPSSIAASLYAAMKGLGTDEDAVFTQLEGVQSAPHWDQVQDAFAEMHADFYNGNVTVALKDELTAAEWAKCAGILGRRGVELGGGLHPTPSYSTGGLLTNVAATEPSDPARENARASLIAAGLYKAVKGWGTDEAAVFKHLRAVGSRAEWADVGRCFAAQYPSYHGGDVVKALRDDLTSKEVDQCNAILAPIGVSLTAPLPEAGGDGDIPDAEFVASVRRLVSPRDPSVPPATKAELLNRVATVTTTTTTTMTSSVASTPRPPCAQPPYERGSRTPDTPPTQATPAAAVAAHLHKAMKGFGTDEDGVYNALALVEGPAHWREVRREFAARYAGFCGGDVAAALRSELTASELAKAEKVLRRVGVDLFAASHNPRAPASPEAIADIIHKAVKGMGTDEAAVYAALREVASQAHWFDVCDAFAVRHPECHDGRVRSALKDDMTSRELARCEEILRASGVDLWGGRDAAPQPPAGDDEATSLRGTTRRLIEENARLMDQIETLEAEAAAGQESSAARAAALQAEVDRLSRENDRARAELERAARKLEEREAAHAQRDGEARRKLAALEAELRATSASPPRPEAPRPTPTPPATLADALYRAMKGWGTDEDGIYRALASVQDAAHWEGVRGAFREHHSSFHRGDVVAALRDDLTSKELAKCAAILQERGVDLYNPRSPRPAASATFPFANAASVADGVYDGLAAGNVDAVYASLNRVEGEAHWLAVRAAFAAHHPRAARGDVARALGDELTKREFAEAAEVLRGKGVALGAAPLEVEELRARNAALQKRVEELTMAAEKAAADPRELASLRATVEESRTRLADRAAECERLQAELAAAERERGRAESSAADVREDHVRAEARAARQHDRLARRLGGTRRRLAEVLARWTKVGLARWAWVRWAQVVPAQSARAREVLTRENAWLQMRLRESEATAAAPAAAEHELERLISENSRLIMQLQELEERNMELRNSERAAQGEVQALERERAHLRQIVDAQHSAPRSPPRAPVALRRQRNGRAAATLEAVTRWALALRYYWRWWAGRLQQLARKDIDYAVRILTPIVGFRPPSAVSAALAVQEKMQELQAGGSVAGEKENSGFITPRRSAGPGVPDSPPTRALRSLLDEAKAAARGYQLESQELERKLGTQAGQCRRAELHAATLEQALDTQKLEGKKLDVENAALRDQLQRQEGKLRKAQLDAVAHDDQIAALTMQARKYQLEIQSREDSLNRVKLHAWEQHDAKAGKAPPSQQKRFEIGWQNNRLKLLQESMDAGSRDGTPRSQPSDPRPHASTRSAVSRR